MKSDWTEKKLGDFCEVKGGKRLPKGINLVKENSGHPYIRIRDLTNKKYIQLDDDFEFVDIETQKLIGRYIVDDGDILISIVGTIGLVSIVGETLKNANLTENCVKLTNLQGIDHQYLYYYLVSCYGQNEIKRGTVGAVQPKLPIKNIQDITIRYPIELKEQKKIASILKTLDDKIALNNEINKNLEQQVSLVYDTLLSDCNIALQEIALGDIAEISSGKRPPMRSNTITKDANIPLIGASSVMGYTNEANHCDTILVTGRVGTHGIVQRLNTPCWTSDNTLVITSKYYEFVYQILQRIDYQSMNRGSTQPLITQGDMKKVVIKLPDTHSLNEFENFASTLMKQREANLIENTVLAQARDTLLPRLMSGEIDVSDIDI